MNYYKEFRLKFPNKQFGDVNVKRNCCLGFDENKLTSYDVPVIDKGWEIYLEHQCDEWVIGEVEDARLMIKNLNDAINYISSSLQ